MYRDGVALDSLTPQQAQLVEFRLSGDLGGHDEQLHNQAATVRTSGSSCDCGCPSFYLDPDRSTAATRSEPAGPLVEAHGRDPGGNFIGVLLWVRDGYLSEVEVFGYEASEFAGLPNPGALSFSQWSEPDESGARSLLNP